MSKVEANKLVQIALSKIKQDDITHRGFLKPIEVALKTYKTQISDPDSKIKPGSLPAGLKIAVKMNQESDKRTLLDVQGIHQSQTLLDLRTKSQDNMLSLMKHAQGIELAICVCMYSEDKKMLKSTIAGIAENIANLVAFNEIEADKIGVFVMMDGIEKVDESIISYYEELEKSSNINLGDNIVPPVSVAQMAKRAETMTEEEINEEDMKNVNNFLFDPAQLADRNAIRFESVWRDYWQKKKLLKQIRDLLKSKHLTYEDLPARMQAFFIQEARRMRRIDHNQTEEQVQGLGVDVLLEQYASNVNVMRPILVKSLQKGQDFCKNYLTIREDLAHLSFYRKKVNFDPEHYLQEDGQKKRKSNDQQDSADNFQDEIAEDDISTVMNLFLCVKYKNSGKLSSHNWFFNGFCKELRPKYAILLDVGLRPQAKALMQMYRYMRDNEKVGGVCGYMSLKIQQVDESEQINDEQVDFLTSLVSKVTDIQRTQQVEYHFAHLMDKPFEAAFGFIHVLPGAFSAYNMKAILDYEATDDDELLKNYFKSIDQKLANRKIINSEMGVANAILRVVFPDMINNCCISVDPESDEAMLYNENVYLAEDRILCMGIHTKGFDMAYLPDAYAEVDPIKTVHGLLGQRKRWINGSYFAFEKVKRQLKEHQAKKGCEIGLSVQIFYLNMMNWLAYFAPSFLLFTVHIAMDAFRQDILSKLLQGVINDSNNSSMFYNAFTYTMDFIYIMLISGVVFFSLHLTNNHKKFKPYIYAVSTLLGLFMLIVFAVLIVDIIRGLVNNANFLVANANAIQTIPGGLATIDAMRWILIGSIAIYGVPIFFYGLFFCRFSIACEILFGSLSFLFYTPTYLIILNVYSLCRIDDISWGTKGLDSGSDKNANLKGSWKLIKFVHVAKYVIWNIIVAAVLLTLGSSYSLRFWVTFIMVILIALSMGIKVLVGVIYMLIYRIRTCSYDRRRPAATSHSQIRATIDRYSTEIREEVENHLNCVKDEYINNRGGSFIQAARNKSIVKKAFQRQQNFSSIQKNSIKNTLSRAPLVTIPEERHGPSRRPPVRQELVHPVPRQPSENMVPPRPEPKVEENSSILSSEPDLNRRLNPPKLAPLNPPPFDSIQKRQQKPDKNKFKNLKK